jgi:hypothetical protein
MPESVRLFRVLLASPSDVIEEYPLLMEVVADWNIQHGDRRKTRLELVNWRTHSYPDTGTRPQALVNRQFPDRADVVVAVFWRKLGSPTGKAASGTVEEIERALKRRKKVMIYFSQRTGTDAEPGERQEQAKKIELYKRQIGQNALYGTYKDVKEFQANARRDLALLMNELTAGKKKR